MCTAGDQKARAGLESFQPLYERVKALVQGPCERTEKLRAISALIAEQVPHYHWVGFYLVDDAHSGELVLGPFVGEPTEHLRIPVGLGICGQAAERRATITVQDVALELNYLACSPHVKAEIVVPILRAGKLLGVLDVDSHFRSPFSVEDRTFLEQVCELVAVLV
jgi:L-methionine (R)-S-oxide reductase